MRSWNESWSVRQQGREDSERLRIETKQHHLFCSLVNHFQDAYFELIPWVCDGQKNILALPNFQNLLKYIALYFLKNISV